MMSDRIESEELIKKVQEVEDPEKAAELIQECESIIRTNKKGIIRIAYHQGKIFKENSKTRRSLNHWSTS